MKNFRYNQTGTIDCDIDHPVYGVIPTTLSKEESKKVIDSGADIAAYIAPKVSISEQIAQVESEAEALKTPRLRREAALGIEFKPGQLASDRLIEIDQEAEAKIAELRKQL